MKKLWLLLLAIITLMTLFSCDDEVKLLSAIQDGEELEEGSSVPFLLFENFPNPFNPTTVIRYQVAVQMHLHLKVFTDDWQEVRTLVDREHVPGAFQVQFDGRDSEDEPIASGEYFYTLEGGGLTLVRKMKLLK